MPTEVATPSRRVFLSYRREDCAIHAGRLADNLKDRAIADVFIDVDDIKLGEDFERRIEEEIARCDAFLIMIGDDWLTLTGPDRRPRIFDPMDWVHLEVQAALDRDVPVIPVLVEETMMPRPEQLPEALRGLASRQGAEMRESSWRIDFDRLAAGLPDPVSEVAKSTPSGKDQQQRKERASIDFVAARSFIESIPRGRWASYKDVSTAGGSPTGAMAVGNWLAANEGIPNVWRVLRSGGRVSQGFSASDPNLPQTPEAVQALLTTEGVTFSADRASQSDRWSIEDAAEAGIALAMTLEERSADSRSTASDVLIVAGRQAYPDYHVLSAYICQPGRSFRSGIERLGFYTSFEIKPEIPRILHRRDNVEFSQGNAAHLESSGEEFDDQVAALVSRALDPSTGWYIEREAGQRYQVFLLTPAEDSETLTLPAGIRHEGEAAWVQSQRYASSDLLRNATTTDDL